MGVQPKYNRWGLCSQKYCFSDALPDIVKGYFGSGKVLPICRGDGIDQRLLQHFAWFLEMGDWCHFFPEGGIWKLNELVGRGYDRIFSYKNKLAEIHPPGVSSSARGK